MATDNGLSSYTAGQKKNWRRWQWNRIIERLAVPVRDAVVLYLVGPEDVDREVAVAKGFRPENLIAVDIASRNIQRVRAGGGLGICADLNDVIASWPQDWSLDAVVADFCGGFNQAAFRLLDALRFRGASHQTVVSVNLLRGRDPESNEGRSVLKKHGNDPDLSRHRGKFFTLSAMAVVPAAVLADDLLVGSAHTHGVESLLFRERLLNSMRPAWNSYTSTGRTYFDSAVLAWPASRRPIVPEWHHSLLSTRRKIAACRALRTMKRAS